MNEHEPEITAALVVAAGRGQRLGGGIPKQYLALGGKSLLRYSLEALLAHPAIDLVQAVIHTDDRELYEDCSRGLDLPSPVEGGAERQDSVRLGLEGLAAHAPARVLIHDAARPFPPAGMIDDVLTAIGPGTGAIPGLPVSDSLKRGEGRTVIEAVSREGLYRVQTPQGFLFGEILGAHRAAAGLALTDDAAVAQAAGLRIRIVEGSVENEKITTAADFSRAEAALSKRRETRGGQGFDVHRFSNGDHVMLCGIRVPHEKGLAGHSDADVGLHALTDALLGAIGAGDIGAHFPPSDPRWKDAPSNLFLEEAARQVAARGGRVVSLDVTLVCESPKIGPHREAMRQRIAEILDIAQERVSVKATTTEGLGFTGRGEGIAAFAAANIELPRDD